MVKAPDVIAREVKRALAEVAVQGDAEPMRAYMKSAMPFLGVKKPARVRALSPIWSTLQLDRPEQLETYVSAIWTRAEHREVRYAAIDLLDHRRHRRLHELPLLPLLTRLVTEGAWWDLVDACARPIGHLVQRSPETMKPVLHGWAEGSDLWLRRSALIAQLRFGTELDFPLLEALIETALTAPGLDETLSLKDRRFFVQKAAGWALRTHARVAPDQVRDYLDRHPELPSLTRREAGKHL